MGSDYGYLVSRSVRPFCTRYKALKAQRKKDLSFIQIDINRFGVCEKPSQREPRATYWSKFQSILQKYPLEDLRSLRQIQVKSKAKFTKFYKVFPIFLISILKRILESVIYDHVKVIQWTVHINLHRIFVRSETLQFAHLLQHLSLSRATVPC